MNNPYRPPNSPVRDPRSNTRGATWKAIALGLAADIGGTLVFSLIASIIYGMLLAAQGLNEEAIIATFSDTPYQVFGLLSGAIFTAIGGYVAARVANHLEYRHGLYVGLASLLSGEVLVQLLGSETELWLHISSLILVLPAAITGAHMRVKHKRAEQ